MISSCLIRDFEFEFNFKNAFVLKNLKESFVTYYDHARFKGLVFNFIVVIREYSIYIKKINLKVNIFMWESKFFFKEVPYISMCVYTHIYTNLHVIFVIIYFGVVCSIIYYLFQLRLFIPLNNGWIQGKQLRFMGGFE